MRGSLSRVGEHRLALLLRPSGDSVPIGKLRGILRSPLVCIPLPTLKIRYAQKLQVPSERIANQRGTAHVEPSGRTISRAQQFVFDHDSNRTHAVDATPQPMPGQRLWSRVLPDSTIEAGRLDGRVRDARTPRRCEELHVVRSAVVSTAGTRASSPECWKGGGRSRRRSCLREVRLRSSAAQTLSLNDARSARLESRR